MSKALNAKGGSGKSDGESETFVAHSLRAEGFDARGGVPFTLAIRGRGDSHDLECRQDGTANAVLTPNGGRAGIGVGAVAFDWQAPAAHSFNPKETAGLRRGTHPAVQGGMTVRRLTPRECERLQGFQDDYTLIDFEGKPAADGPRYRAVGNSMATVVMRWIGKRIAMSEATA